MWGDELEATSTATIARIPGASRRSVTWLVGRCRSRLAERLAADCGRIDAAREGVKVWKNLGLHLRDARGELLLPDDERLTPTWAAAAALRAAGAIHVADPVAFFDPLDERNERLEELLEHPDWWFGDRERFPGSTRYARTLEAVVAAARGDLHRCSCRCAAEDLGWVDRMLGTYPNFLADIAARLAEFGRVPRAAATCWNASPVGSSSEPTGSRPIRKPTRYISASSSPPTRRSRMPRIPRSRRPRDAGRSAGSPCPTTRFVGSTARACAGWSSEAVRDRRPPARCLRFSTR